MTTARGVRRLAVVLVAGVAALVAVAGPAFAHVEVEAAPARALATGSAAPTTAAPTTAAGSSAPAVAPPAADDGGGSGAGWMFGGVLVGVLLLGGVVIAARRGPLGGAGPDRPDLRPPGETPDGPDGPDRGGPGRP